MSDHELTSKPLGTRYVAVEAIEVYRGGTTGKHGVALHMRLPSMVYGPGGVLLLTPDETRTWAGRLLEAADLADRGDERASWEAPETQRDWRSPEATTQRMDPRVRAEPEEPTSWRQRAREAYEREPDTTPAGECGQPWWPGPNDGDYDDAKACHRPAGHEGRCGPEPEPDGPYHDQLGADEEAARAEHAWRERHHTTEEAEHAALEHALGRPLEKDG